MWVGMWSTLVVAMAVSGAAGIARPVATATLPWPANKTTTTLQPLLATTKKPPSGKNITSLDDAVATAMAIKDHVARSADAVKAAPDPSDVAAWKAAGVSDLTTGQRCFGYTVALTLAMTGPCPSPPPSTTTKPERHPCHPRSVADAAGADVRAAVVTAGDPAATVVVERYACAASVLTARLYVGARWPALQAAVPPLSAAVGAGGAAAAAALPTAAERLAKCGGGALTTPSSLAVDTSFLVNVALETFGPGSTSPGSGYPVGPLSVVANYTVGGARYSTVTDTGSPLVSVPCNTPYSASLCASLSPAAASALAASYAPPMSATMGAAECASSTATDCFGYLRDPNQVARDVQQPACWFAQRLTGGAARYSPEGFYSTGAPMVFSTKTSCQSTPSLAFGATIACGVSFRQCTQNDGPNCDLALVDCPPSWRTATSECIYETTGAPQASELGWQFAVPYSDAPLASYNSVPTQVLRSGLMAQRKLSFCWTQPDTAYNCSAVTAPPPVPSYNVLGPARPRAIKAGGGALGTAPLTCEAKTTPPNTTTDGPTQKFWAHLASVTIQPPASLRDERPKVVQFAAGDKKADTLLDTGAGSQQKVPKKVFEEFDKLADRGLDAANELALQAGFRDGVQYCSDPAYYCDRNASKKKKLACRVITLKTADDVAKIVTAAQILQDSWPTSLSMAFEGGTGPPATMPGAFVRYACDVSTGTLPAPGDSCVVVGCSYVDEYDYAWLAGPFFYRNSSPPPGGPPPTPGGTWTEFDMSAPPPGAGKGVCGTMTYATAAVDCAY